MFPCSIAHNELQILSRRRSEGTSFRVRVIQHKNVFQRTRHNFLLCFQCTGMTRLFFAFGKMVLNTIKVIVCVMCASLQNKLVSGPLKKHFMLHSRAHGDKHLHFLFYLSGFCVGYH